MRISYTLSTKRKNKKKQKGGKKVNTPPNQPGKSIEDILRELETRVSGKQSPKPASAPSVPVIEAKESVTIKEKTVADFKNEIHSGMAKHHITEQKLHDGKFDDIDDKLMHLERFELDAHQQNEHALYSPEDMRRAIILNTILERPDY